MRAIIAVIVASALLGCQAECACEADAPAARNDNTAGGESDAPEHTPEEEAADLIATIGRLPPGPSVADVRAALGGRRYSDPGVEATRAICLQASEAIASAGNRDANELRRHCDELFRRAQLRLSPARTVETIDRTFNGDLTDSDPRVDDDSPYDEYTVQLSEGWVITADMRSAMFDTYLWLIGPDGSSLVQDDDGGEGTNSRFVYTATVAGTYTLRANSYDGAGRGAYTLHVQAGPS